TTVAADEARRYARHAIAQAPEVPGLPHDPRRFEQAAVIGAGTMGVGISMALANNGIETVLVDIDESSLSRAMARIRSQYETSVARKRLSDVDMDRRLSLITASSDYASISRADVIIEAVWEQASLKKQVF